ncbi:AAA family ATPase [Streptomyces goshikiensis]|uniref:AAA family ATPase n=2 Tax=Streptomyces goshikiensis TaxID=1942 RepID=UPI0036ADD45A
MTGNATNVIADARAPLVAAAKRHDMPVVAVMVSTPASVCVERQGPRPANRTVPDDTVLAQHKAMVRSHPKLLAEGFNEVVFSDSLCQLLPCLQRLGDARNADLGLDGGDGPGELLLVRRAFGEEVLPLWRWKPGSTAADGDRVAEICLGRQYLTCWATLKMPMGRARTEGAHHGKQVRPAGAVPAGRLSARCSGRRQGAGGGSQSNSMPKYGSGSPV